MSDTKSKPLDGLWTIIMYQCRFINCDKCTILVGDADNGGVCASVGAVDIWVNFEYLPLNFAANLKPL